MIDKQIYTPEECADLFPFLDTLEIEYHKPYKRFNQIVKVPRGQASYTLDDTIQGAEAIVCFLVRNKKKFCWSAHRVPVLLQQAFDASPTIYSNSCTAVRFVRN